MFGLVIQLKKKKQKNSWRWETVAEGSHLYFGLGPWFGVSSGVYIQEESWLGMSDIVGGTRNSVSISL